MSFAPPGPPGYYTFRPGPRAQLATWTDDEPAAAADAPEPPRWWGHNEDLYNRPRRTRETVRKPDWDLSDRAAPLGRRHRPVALGAWQPAGEWQRQTTAKHRADPWAAPVVGTRRGTQSWAPAPKKPPAKQAGTGRRATRPYVAWCDDDPRAPTPQQQRPQTAPSAAASKRRSRAGASPATPAASRPGTASRPPRPALLEPKQARGTAPRRAEARLEDKRSSKPAEAGAAKAGAAAAPRAARAAEEPAPRPAPASASATCSSDGSVQTAVVGAPAAPLPLPTGWTRLTTAKGDDYYWEVGTGTVSWKPPPPPPPPPPLPPPPAHHPLAAPAEAAAAAAEPAGEVGASRVDAPSPPHASPASVPLLAAAAALPAAGLPTDRLTAGWLHPAAVPAPQHRATPPHAPLPRPPAQAWGGPGGALSADTLMSASLPPAGTASGAFPSLGQLETLPGHAAPQSRAAPAPAAGSAANDAWERAVHQHAARTRERAEAKEAALAAEERALEASKRRSEVLREAMHEKRRAEREAAHRALLEQQAHVWRENLALARQNRANLLHCSCDRSTLSPSAQHGGGGGANGGGEGGAKGGAGEAAHAILGPEPARLAPASLDFGELPSPPLRPRSPPPPPPPPEGGGQTGEGAVVRCAAARHAAPPPPAAPRSAAWTVPPPASGEGGPPRRRRQQRRPRSPPVTIVAVDWPPKPPPEPLPAPPPAEEVVEAAEVSAPAAPAVDFEEEEASPGRTPVSKAVQEVVLEVQAAAAAAEEGGAPEEEGAPELAEPPTTAEVDPDAGSQLLEVSSQLLEASPLEASQEADSPAPLRAAEMFLDSPFASHFLRQAVAAS